MWASFKFILHMILSTSPRYSECSPEFVGAAVGAVVPRCSFKFQYYKSLSSKSMHFLSMTQYGDLALNSLLLSMDRGHYPQ